MTSNLTPIGPAALDAVWPTLAPLAGALIDQVGRKLSFTDLRVAVETGSVGLIVVTDADDAPTALFVVQVSDFPRARVAEVFASGAPEVIAAATSEVEAAVRAQSTVDRVQFHVSPNCVAALGAQHYHVTQVIIERNS
jgi:hypothetical protein